MNEWMNECISSVNVNVSMLVINNNNIIIIS